MLHQIDDLGGSTVEVLRALGHSHDGIAELAAAGTIFVGDWTRSRRDRAEAA